MNQRILIVGASLGGLRAAEQLRLAGFTGTITMIGAERRAPYNRPPLSKEMLYTAAEGRDPFETVAFGLRPNLAVEWKLGARAMSTNLSERWVALDSGERIIFDALVVATGLRPRRVPLLGGEARRFVLRTLDDALRLRAELRPGTSVVIIGGGFIGCEIAASATRLGCQITIVEPLAVPMQRAIGTMLGRAIQSVHEREAISFLLHRTVVAFESAAQDRVGVWLDDGQQIIADVVVEAVGSVPNAEWLADNGLDLSDGLLCDNHMQVQGLSRVVSVGDIARFPNPFSDDVPRRVEHWSTPGVTARRAAETLFRSLRSEAPDPEPFSPIPTFWSDQYDLRIQCVGMPGLGDHAALLEGTLDLAGIRREGAAVGYWRGQRLIGVAAVAVPPNRMAQYQSRVAREQPRPVLRSFIVR